MVDLSVDRILAAVGAVAGVAGAIAAGLAAYYSMGAPTKADLERVERNTGDTAKHLQEVDRRLDEQHRQDLLISKAWKVSINVEGNGLAEDPLTLIFIVNTPGVALISVELLNEAKMQFGTCECRPGEGRAFACVLEPRVATAWFYGGKQIAAHNRKLVQIRAHLNIEGRDAFREFATHITEAHRTVTGRGMLTSYLIEGSC